MEKIVNHVEMTGSAKEEGTSWVIFGSLSSSSEAYTKEQITIAHVKRSLFLTLSTDMSCTTLSTDELCTTLSMDTSCITLSMDEPQPSAWMRHAQFFAWTNHAQLAATTRA
ncbi:hypothetical protein L2E82_43559 [Cichorium intybus]|uniref:Uncharacterized protein n=1 Tax=Cichorium intybus TaxID=13427 RepID=A0ACB8ZPS8_CICIN|nr:hypothetical protein L2E82_43559 [Cichorium intybus]